MRSLPRGFWVACIGVFLVGIGARVLFDAASGDDQVARPTVAAASIDLLRHPGDTPRVVSTYGGLGTWIDAFDFAPPYQNAGAAPAVTPSVIDDLADDGVRTLFLQASRLDDRSPGLLLDEGLLAEFLMRAHARGMAVVGWYLPRFEDVDADLDHLLAIARFDALGHRFDGVAVDIEYTEGVPDVAERSARLVELSTRLRAALPGQALGAVVLPPVQLEVINPAYWPDFPWRELAGSYDVWLPMAYWTFRSAESGYRDSYRYAEESTRRMRNNIGRSDAVVHIIGGIGDKTSPADLDGFRRALEDTGAIGGSIYDWNSMTPALRAQLPGVIPG